MDAPALAGLATLDEEPAAPGTGSRAAGTRSIAYGLVDPSDCGTCTPRGSVTGGDLRSSGVGGDLPATESQVDLVVEAGGDPTWIRICDPPP